MAINLGSALVYLGADMTGLNDDLGEAEKGVKGWATSVGNNVLKLTTGAIMGGVTAATAAVVGIGAAALNASMDINTATRNAQSSLGALNGDAELLGTTIKNVYANNWGQSIEDVGQAVTEVSSQMNRMGTMTQEELQAATEKALAFRDVFGLEVTESTQAVNTLMENFGLTSDEAFTLLQSGMQNGLNNSGDLLDTIGEYSNLFREGGASAAEFFNFMDSGLQGGMLGTDKAADLFKEFNIRLYDGSEATKEAAAQLFGYGGGVVNNTAAIGDLNKELLENQVALENLQKKQANYNDSVTDSQRALDDLKIQELTAEIANAQSAMSGLESTNGKVTEAVAGLIDYDGGMTKFFSDLSSGTLSGVDAFSMIQSALSKIEDPIERNQIGVALMGTQFEDLGAAVVAGIDPAQMSMEDWASLTSDLNKRYENFGDMFEGFKRQVIIGLTPLTDLMLDLANSVMPQVQEAFNMVIKPIKGFADYIAFVVEEGDTWNDMLMDIPEVLRPFVLLLGELTNYLANGEHNLELVRGAFERWNPALLPVVDGIAKLVKGVKEFVTKYATPLKAAVLAIGGFFAGWAILSTIAAVVASVAGAIAAAFAVIFSPLTLLIVAIGLLAAAWSVNFAGMQQTAEGIMTAIGQAWNAFGALLNGDATGFLEGLKAAWNTAFSAMAEFIGNLWGIVYPYLESFYNAAYNWFMSVDWLAMGQAVIDQISTVIGTLWSIIEPYLTQFYTDFVTWFTTTDWKQVGTDLVTSLLSGLMSLTTMILPILGTFFETMTTGVNSLDWASIGGAIATAIIYAIGAVVGLLQLISDTMILVFNAIYDWAITQDWAGIGMLIVENIILGLAGLGEALNNALTNAFWGAMDAAGDLLGGAGGSSGGGASGEFASASDTSDFTAGTQNVNNNNAQNNSVNVGTINVNANSQAAGDVRQNTKRGITDANRARGRR